MHRTLIQVMCKQASGWMYAGMGIYMGGYAELLVYKRMDTVYDYKFLTA